MEDARVARGWLAALLIAGFAAGCSGSSAGGAGPSGSPSPAGLPAGAYTSRTFAPAVTATLPAGWWNPSDDADYFALQPVESDQVGIHVFRTPRAASQDAACPLTAAPGVDSGSVGLLTWIRARPGLAVSNPRLVVVGGLSGTEIDIHIADGWTASCPFANGIPTVPLFIGGSGSLRWVIAGSERLRLDILDVPAGGMVVVDQDAFDGADFDSFVNAAAPIVRSLRFAGS
jgi:hypothetical protein